jgi:undecaprenyl-diphosphatase
MTPFQALILGLLQGLAEFLPVSSSAHLALAPWVFGWQDPGLAFDVALHLGTLVALLWYFRAEWRRLLQAFFTMLRTRSVQGVEQRRVMLLIIASVPGAIAGLALEKKADEAFRAPWLIATALILMGILLWAVDRWASQRRHLTDVTPLDALIIGCSQAIALVPGVSRSGATITAGRALQVDREGAAVFSFLMSMPIIAGAALVKVPHLLRAGITPPLVIGIIASAVSGWFAIAVLLRFVRSHSYDVFAVYRVLLGVAVLVLVAVRAGHG